jgi:acylphosphatase
MRNDQSAVRVRVTGRVQGVCYRAWARDEAERLGLAGWVRNEPDGSVAALLIGPPPEVARMLDAMRRGPPAARVTDLTTEPAADLRPPADFRIRADSTGW